MKLLVTVKEIAEVADDFKIADNAIDEKYTGYALNEWDDYAVEEGVQLVEHTACDVRAVADGIRLFIKRL